MSIYLQHWQGFGLAQEPRDCSQSPIFSYHRQDRALPVRAAILLSCTVEPRYNEPMYYENPGITNYFLYPSTVIVKYIKKTLSVPSPSLMLRFHCTELEVLSRVFEG